MRYWILCLLCAVPAAGYDFMPAKSRGYAFMPERHRSCDFMPVFPVEILLPVADELPAPEPVLESPEGSVSEDLVDPFSHLVPVEPMPELKVQWHRTVE